MSGRVAEGRIAVAVLAAGRSERMGAVAKLLLPWRGGPVVVAAVRAALESGVGPVAVVVSADPCGDAVEKALAGLPVTIVRPPAPRLAVAESVRAAASWAFPGHDALAITLADEPDLDPGALRLAAETWCGTGGCGVVRTRYQDRLGHPVVATPGALGEANLEGDHGIFRAGGGGSDWTAVQYPGPAPRDLDRPSAYTAASEQQLAGTEARACVTWDTGDSSES